MISDEEAFLSLRADVQLLATDASVQLAWLQRERFPADELHDQLVDEVFVRLPRLEKARVISPAAKAELQALLDYLEGMKSPVLWADEALAKAPEWRQVRERARKVLTQMDASLQAWKRHRAERA